MTTLPDDYGQIPEVGDIVATSTSNRPIRIGKVYAIGALGLPLIKWAEKDSNRLAYVWRKGVTGYAFVILNKPGGAWLTGPVNGRIELDYDADEPPILGLDVPGHSGDLV